MGTSLRGKRLLLAEDNVLNREIAATLLELNRAAVESAVNGRIAVDRFLQTGPGHFDAILLDVQMPVMDGCEAARQIRACGRPDAKRIPVIAATANAFAEDVSAVPTAGMDAHVSKPLDISSSAPRCPSSAAPMRCHRTARLRHSAQRGLRARRSFREKGIPNKKYPFRFGSAHSGAELGGKDIFMQYAKKAPGG